MKINLPTARGALSGDDYIRVQIDPVEIEAEEASPFQFEFAYIQVEEDGRRELVCVESGVVQQTPVKPGPGGDEVASVTSAVIRNFSERWTQYERAASASLAAAFGIETGAEFSVRSRERRVLSDEFLADVVKRHRDAERQGVPGTKAVADQERVGTSTVRNWLRQARDRGIGQTS